MSQNHKKNLNLLSRRSLLGTAAAMAATPALAEDCLIGPPQHEKGPKVWMDMDQVELDAAYDQSAYAPLIGQILNALPQAAIRHALAWASQSGSPMGLRRSKPSTSIRQKRPTRPFS